ncbi:hypothetical protein HNL35_5 [Bacteroides phage HNL35]|nr:hypothetical protein HNL05_5 [Bacteroides phage HNL05]QIG64587.1 hypothetical protein HNL35_5 [Bacteroides phage HNL35]
MGQKYSINSAGRIVAERDIYSLGGFIPKGRVGAKIADETQLSQNGECWLAGGDISARPDIVIKDNAYIGDFLAGVNPVHTDIITEFSGNTLIPGYLSVRCFAADTKNNTFIKDSFIGVSMDALFGVSSKCHPVEQGRYNQDAPKGTLFTSASMKLDTNNFVRNTATVRLGKDTYVYLPAGFNARIYWAYYDVSNQLAYAGESETVSSNLYKLSHPVYNMCMIAFAKNPTLTPAELEASGAKILGHISGSLLMDLRPESASGEYVIDNSSLVMNTDNFGLTTTQLRFLAGGLYNTNMYTPTDRQDYKPYGTFRNVTRLEYTKYLPDSHRTAATRDTYISAYDCPLLRVDDTTYNGALAAKGGLVLRRCVVPKAEFQDDVVNGNTYEDIDFSYANEDLGFTMEGYTRFISSHKRGIYRMSGGPSSTGFVSHKGNLADTARLYQAEEYIPLDGSIMEQGTYYGETVYYENAKHDDSTRVRTKVPLPTKGAIFPTLPMGFGVRAILYLDENFVCKLPVTEPTTIETTYPYYVIAFRREDLGAALTVGDFIALNRTLRIIDHTKSPEITGSAYVGAGCTVRGDVQLHGDPYVNRVFDVNMWERGEMGLTNGVYWENAKANIRLDIRFRTKYPIPISINDAISAGAGYSVWCIGLDESKTVVANTGAWVSTETIKSDRIKYVIVVVRKGSDVFIDESDIPLANVKYVRAFKKRRYIVNELDRKSPEDILLSVDYWEQGTVGGGQADAGKTYEELKATSGTTIRLKRPINVSPSSSISSVSGFSRYVRVLDAVTKFHLGEALNSAKMSLLAVIIQKDPSAAINPSEIPNSRLVLEFVPQPRIVVPYGQSTLFISGPKIRMYDNAVLSRNLNQEGGIVLQGDAVGGYDFNPGSCMCSNGHSDAIIKLP